ncbi:MAG: DUF58 domain-containing protein [Defluviitaleaceae bacterium]|nr:DUF58 domain-containing protein [Defluviitaleaceae bacterium]
MGVTRRFVILAVSGIFLLLAAALLPSFLSEFVFWMYNLIIFALLVVDFILTPKASDFTVQRINTEKLSHYALNQISFTVHNPSMYIIKVHALDQVSGRHFKVAAKNLMHTIAPHTEKIFSYEVIPSKRGAFTFEYIHLRVQGILGLATKYYSHHCPCEFKVYPNLKDLRRFRIMMQKNRLLPQGDKTVKIFGAGTEFESLRTYVEGDDYRKINWPVTARERRLIVNDYQIEKNQPVFMMIDGGRPMSYSVKGYKKLDYAINAALVLSDIVNQKGDQSGLLVFDREIRSLVMPGKGEVHRNNLMETLYHIHDTKDTSNYEAAFLALCQKQKRRSLVFIFTDFETLEEARELTNHVAHLKRFHFPIVVFMKNEELIALTSHYDVFVQEVARSFLDERRELFRTLNTMAIPNVETTAENFSTTAVNQYLLLRKI